MTMGQPFDDIRDLASRLPWGHGPAAGQVRAGLSASGSHEELGRLGELAVWFAEATGHAHVARPRIALFAATHALTARLTGTDPVPGARAAMEAIASGAAPVSHLCAAAGLGLNVFDLALDMPVEDITRRPALDEKAAAATMAFGMEVLASGADLIGLGTVDAASDISAMALISAIMETDGAEWEKRGEVIKEALASHTGHLGDPLEAMSRLGGREIAALAGAILAARMQDVAVVLDGLAATAAAKVLHKLNPEALTHCCLASAVSDTHRKAAARIGLEPLLDLKSSGSGGVGAALTAGLIKSAGDVSTGLSEVRRRKG